MGLGWLIRITLFDISTTVTHIFQKPKIPNYSSLLLFCFQTIWWKYPESYESCLQFINIQSSTRTILSLLLLLWTTCINFKHSHFSWWNFPVKSVFFFFGYLPHTPPQTLYVILINTYYHIHINWCHLRYFIIYWFHQKY